MLFRSFYGDERFSLGPFMAGDMRKLVKATLESPFGFDDYSGDITTILRAKADDPAALLFSVRSGKKVVGYGILDAIVHGKRANLRGCKRYDGWARGKYIGGLLLISFAFKKLNLLRLTAMCHERNYPAIRLAKAYGFEEEGRLKSSWVRGSSVEDTIILGLINKEWKNA